MTRIFLGFGGLSTLLAVLGMIHLFIHIHYPDRCIGCKASFVELLRVLEMRENVNLEKSKKEE